MYSFFFFECFGVLGYFRSSGRCCRKARDVIRAQEREVVRRFGLGYDFACRSRLFVELGESAGYFVCD